MRPRRRTGDRASRATRPRVLAAMPWAWTVAGPSSVTSRPISPPAATRPQARRPAPADQRHRRRRQPDRQDLADQQPVESIAVAKPMRAGSHWRARTGMLGCMIATRPISTVAPKSWVALEHASARRAPRRRGRGSASCGCPAGQSAASTAPGGDGGRGIGRPDSRPISVADRPMTADERDHRRNGQDREPQGSARQPQQGEATHHRSIDGPRYPARRDRPSALEHVAHGAAERGGAFGDVDAGARASPPSCPRRYRCRRR